MFDFHTHIIMGDGTPCLLNVPVVCRGDRFYRDDRWDSGDGFCGDGDACGEGGVRACVQDGNVAFSVGVHPWDVGEDWEERVETVRREAARSRVWAVGECGLDKLCGTAFDLQLKAFYAQVDIAEDVGKPMVIHCVRAFNELMAIRKEIGMRKRGSDGRIMPWVIHGFRGKPDLAKQLMSKGFMLSFGQRYNIETLCEVFASSRPFFLETDDCHQPICQIYGQVARHLGVDVARLEALCDPRRSIFSGLCCC